MKEVFIINTDKLTNGMVVKNYRELCSLVEEEIKDGNSKKAQMKEFERYFKYHKEGYKFVIDEVYETPLPKEDNARNTVYGTHIENLILHLMTTLPLDENNAITLNRNNLFLLLQMVNENYVFGRANINQFSRKINIPTQVVYDFYSTSNTKMKSAVERTLNRLQSRCLINYTLPMMVKESEGYNPPRRATKEEEAIIAETERNVLVEMGFSTRQEVFFKGEWSNFQMEINSRLDKLCGIKYYFKAYHINTTKDFREMLLDEYELMYNFGELNAKLYFNMIDSGKTIHEHRVKKFENKEPRYENDKCALLPQYEDFFKRLFNITMDDYPRTIYTNDDLKGISYEVLTCDEYLRSLIEEENDKLFAFLLEEDM